MFSRDGFKIHVHSDVLRVAKRSLPVTLLLATLVPAVAPAQDVQAEVQAEWRTGGDHRHGAVPPENVQDTPIAMTAVNAAMLESRSQYSIYEVAAQAPNVTLTPGGVERGSSMIAFIRGVGQTDFNFAVEPGVGIYVDDVYFSTLTGSLLDLLDLDRVEIARGPQGTLAGRNSIGGTIKLYSVQPGDDEGGKLQATFGDYDRVDFRGSAGFTLVEDKLYARIAGASRARDGYVKRLDYGCVHPESGIPTYNTGHVESCELGTEGGISYTAARAALKWTPTEELGITFSGDIVNDASEPPPTTLRRVNEGVNNPNLPIGVGSANGNFVNAPSLSITRPARRGNLPRRGSRPNTTTDRVYYSNAFVTHGPFRGDNLINDPYVTYTTYLDPNSPTPRGPSRRSPCRRSMSWTIGASPGRSTGRSTRTTRSSRSRPTASTRPIGRRMPTPRRSTARCCCSTSITTSSARNCV